MTTAHPQDDHMPADDMAADDTAATSDDIAPAPEGDARLAEMEAKVTEANERALRALAEAENTRKRLEKERQDTAKYAISGFARDLLAVADNLRRALNAVTPEQQAANAELKNIFVGVEMTERVLLQMFEKNNIRKIDPQGEIFDPNLHEVIFETEMPGQAAGTIVQVIEPGYIIHDRLLRPARVGVAKGGDGIDAGGHLDTSA
jgi:molecular chaperone GrpE